MTVCPYGTQPKAGVPAFVVVQKSDYTTWLPTAISWIGNVPGITQIRLVSTAEL